MDELQVLALILELIGFGLAFLHVFRENFTELTHKKLTSVMDHLGANGVDFCMPGADEDESLPIEERSAIVSNNLIIIIVFLVCTFSVYSWIDLGDGIFFGILQLVGSAILGTLLMIAVMVTYMVFVNTIVWLVSLSGKGDIVAGIGFIFAACGMAIETYQIWHSSLSWAALLIWGVVIVFIVWCSRSKVFNKEINQRP